jgi:hypothetical protein
MVSTKRNRKPKTTAGRKPQPKTKTIQRSKPPTRRASSKQQGVLDLLRRPEGASIAAICEATGWRQHSVRGFFAGVIRKKLSLTLDSTKADGVRIYRVIAAKSSKPKADAATVEHQAA